jgi:hypothetical protein
MGKIRTNILEIVLKKTLIGEKFYDNNGNLVDIDDINFQPLTNTVIIKSGNNGYKLSLNELYDFNITDISENERIGLNKGKIISSYNRNK